MALLFCLALALAACGSRAGSPQHLEARAFSAGPSPVERGADLTLVWDVPGARSIRIQPLAFDHKLGQWVPEAGAAPLTSSLASGRLTFPVPADARYPLRFDLEAVGADGQATRVRSEVVELVCHPALAEVGGHCPSAPRRAPGAYQTFEHGALLWRGDTGVVYLLPAHPDYYTPWIARAMLATPRPIGLKQGAFEPGAHFRGLWSREQVEVGELNAAPPAGRRLAWGELLGQATSAEQLYTLRLQADWDDSQSGLLDDRLLLSLPDGGLAVLAVSGDRLSGPAWQVLAP